MLTITSTVPTKDQVLIPESLLKKRKTQEKTQAERDQALAEKKKVQLPPRERNSRGNDDADIVVNRRVF
jgi:large subunit ribosomal protein L7e